MISRHILVATLLFASVCGPAASAQPAGPGDIAAAGHYRMHVGPDSASELELLPTGHFQFFLAAGALDLMAEGRWTSDGHNVTLNTEPRPVPAAFSVGPVARGRGPLVIRVTDPNGHGIALIDLRVGFADGHVVEGYTQDYGWHPTGAGRGAAARWVELRIGMYGTPPHRFPLNPAAGHDFTFILTPNDLGVQDFHDTLLPITSEGLVLTLLGGQGIFVRERPEE